jgi:phage I-like protein
MNLRILNRDFRKPADEWFHIVPKGRFAHADSGKVQVIDEKALTAMVNRFNEEAKGANFTGLLVDFDHFSYEPSKSSEAAGWITALEKRDAGLFGKIRFTDAGEAAITNGRYRLISPVWLPRDTEDLSKGEFRPLRLDTAGLTNQPNLRGMVPLSNRAPGGDADSHKQNNKGQTMKSVCALLGLSEDANEASVHAAVLAIKNRAEKAEGEVGPIKNRVTQLEGENAALLEAQVEADLAKYANRIKPEFKEKVKAQLIANRAGTIELLEAMPEGKGAETQQHKPLHNRNTTLKVKSVSENIQEDREAEEQKAVAIKNRATELFTANQARGWDACWNQATDEVSAK